jgi:Mg-chelatase subunit ChlD
MNASTNATHYELNKGDQFIVAIDNSGSMNFKGDVPKGMTRSEYAKSFTSNLIKEAIKYDPDGVDIIIFDSSIRTFEGVTEQNLEQVLSVVNPSGSTATADALKVARQLTDKKLQAGEKENIVTLVITDGVPNDKEAVKTVLRDWAGSLPDGEQVGVSFLIVGTPDETTVAFFTEIDDNLNAAHDIVDVKRLDEVNLEMAFAGAIHD